MTTASGPFLPIRCTFSLSELEYQYPSELVEAGLTIAQAVDGQEDR